MDIVTAARRSEMMSCIRGRDTKPELLVRRRAHRLGYRFRLHQKDLPGSPDLVFAGRRKVIFVHGCFWHQHPGCRFAYRPKSNQEFWRAKLTKNVTRDARVQEELQKRKWGVLTIWECETSDADALDRKLRGYLDHASA